MNKEIIKVNPGDKDWTNHRFILWTTAWNPTYYMIWADHLEDAIDELIDWCADNAPGLIVDDQIQEEFNRLKSDGDQMLLPFRSDEELWEEAAADTTCGGNCGNFISSEDWGIESEDPTRQDILQLEGRAA